MMSKQWYLGIFIDCKLKTEMVANTIARCPNNHNVDIDDVFCKICGSTLQMHNNSQLSPINVSDIMYDGEPLLDTFSMIHMEPDGIRVIIIPNSCVDDITENMEPIDLSEIDIDELTMEWILQYKDFVSNTLAPNTTQYSISYGIVPYIL